MTLAAPARRLLGTTIANRAAAAPRILAAAWGALAIAAVLSVSLGPTGITLGSLPRAIAAALGASSDASAQREALILLDIRLPRTLLAIFVGGALAFAGAMLQGLFRNPLADPALIGISPAAAFAAVTTIALGSGILAPVLAPLGVYALPFAAFAGAGGTTLALVAIAARRGELMIGTLLLAGIALGALASAGTGLIAFLSDDRQLRDLTLWMMGSLGGASWPKVLAVAPFAALLLAAAPRMTRALNGLLLGEAEAFHLGIDVEATKRLVVLATGAAVGAAVAVAGIIGFVGIVVPHMVRMIAGPDHRVVLPGSALLGAALLLIADIGARMLMSPAELPIGIVMAAMGAPVFLHMVLKRGIGGME